ncbi:hypothetical protein ACFL5O_06050 [Myxococcota bacterium]
MRNFVSLLVALTAACAGAPQTDPPGRITVVGPPSLHQDLVDFEWRTTTEASIFGEPGAVSAQDGRVTLVNLDAEQPVQRVIVASDGSFQATIPADVGDEIHILAWDQYLASEPYDARLTQTVLEPIDRSQLCWELGPRTVVWFMDTKQATVTVANHCEQAVLLSGVVVRAGQSAFSITRWPEQVAPSEQAEIVLEYSPTGADRDEGVLLIEATAPEPVRVPLSLAGQAGGR